MSEEEVTHWVELPAGTKHVRFGDLPHLIALALWPDVENSPLQDFKYGTARLNLEDELRKAVLEERLRVRNSLTFGPHTFPLGETLKRALVMVPDLRNFLARRGGDIGVRLSTPQPSTLETTNQRCTRLLRSLREETAKQARGALARVVRRDGRARQTVSADIKKALQAEAASAGPIAVMARIVRK